LLKSFHDPVLSGHDRVGGFNYCCLLCRLLFHTASKQKILNKNETRKSKSPELFRASGLFSARVLGGFNCRL